jgi:hypothetical protein
VPILARAHSAASRDVHRLAPGAVADLVPAAESVGDDQRCRRRGPYRRQQIELGHFHRHVEVLRFVSKRSGHPAAARLDHARLQPRDPFQDGAYRVESGERLLMAVTVQERFGVRQGFKLEREPSGVPLAHQKLLEQQRVLRQQMRVVAESVGQEFVAQGEQA